MTFNGQVVESRKCVEGLLARQFRVYLGVKQSTVGGRQGGLSVSASGRESERRTTATEEYESEGQGRRDSVRCIREQEGEGAGAGGGCWWLGVGRSCLPYARSR